MPARGGFAGGFRGGFAGGAGGQRPATCYKCGGPNHYARDCQAQAMKCYACGKLVSGYLGGQSPAIRELTVTGSHLTRLHRPQWRTTQFCRKGLLQVWSSWAHLSRLHCRRDEWSATCRRCGRSTSNTSTRHRRCLSSRIWITARNRFLYCIMNIRSLQSLARQNCL